MEGHVSKSEASIFTFEDFVGIASINKDPKKIILYRGQPSDYPLLPRICRDDPKKDTTAKEKVMLDELRRLSIRHGYAYQSSWDWLAMAQHHGMDTRLLDWTTNPLAALWFACSSKTLTGVYSVVWLFVVDKSIQLDLLAHSDPFLVGSTKVFRPNWITPRLSAQLGWFTAHAYSKKQKRFVTLESNKRYTISKIKVPLERKAQMLVKLDTCGINEASLFPEVDGVCKYLNWKYK
jgi:hypothetical protein